MRSSVMLAIIFAICLFPTVSFAQEKNKVRVGYEILQIKSPNEIVAWATRDITRKQFDSLKLPSGWFKNQPREIEMDRGTFISSPGQKKGKIIRAKHFGFTWMHVATVRKVGISLDSKRLLVGSKVQKNHRVTFEAGKTIKLLISPKGEVFLRISRDAGRTRQIPKLPTKWQLVDLKTRKALQFQLPSKTLVIRTDNQDSFQGPVKLNWKRKRWF